MKKLFLSIILVCSIGISTFESFGQNDTMLRVKFKSEVLPQLVGDSNTITSIFSLDSLLINYEVEYFSSYYSSKVLNPDLKHYYLIGLFEGTIAELVSGLESLDLTTQIEIMENDSNYSLCQNPVSISDEYIVQGWVNNDALNLSNAQCAWTITTGNPNLRLAIVDTDFDEDHEDLVGQIREVYGFQSGGGEHGTEVLGVAGAKPNSIGIVGAGYNLKWDGSRIWFPTSIPRIAAGIKNADEKGARVINVSMKYTGYTPDAIQDLVDRGVVIVVAAGNEPHNTFHSSYANIPGVIVVSGVDKDGYAGPTNKAKNQWVDLCAVSENVTCLKENSGYGGAWGTSSAAPLVTATAGLILSLNECFTPAQVEYIIKNTTQPILDEHLYSGLVGTGYLDMYEAVKFAAGRSGTLAGNETWETLEIIGGKLTVPSGVTLTIKSDVICYPNASIYVEAGGKLVIDGGKLSSTCESWLGIFIEGNTHLSQHSSASNQGFVEMKNNAIIENAVEAIFVSGLKPNGEIDWSKCGGIIRATNSTFRNNRRDVAFLSYHHYNPSGVEIINYSYFRNCQFLTTDDNKFPSNLLGIHVTMWDVNGVRFQGCTFEDQRSNIVAKTQGRKGIYTIQSTFEVTKNCPFLTSCTAPSKFINLKSAIESFSNGSRGQISVEFSEFDSYKGIYLQGINFASVRANEFTIGHDVLVSGNTDYPYGLYLDQCQNFNTEGNTFNGTTGAANVANGGAAGLVIRNTGANNNNFYRSNFNNMKLASQALSENRETGLDKGLRFRCNYYDENYNDLDVRNDPNNPYSIFGQLGMAELHGIVQGGSPLTPNNQFGNFSSILNYNIENRGNWMQYVYHGTPSQSNLTYPWITTSNVSTFIAGAASTCPDLINNFGVDKGPFKVNLDGIRPLMVVKAQDWDIVTDGGNSQNMKQAILTANGGNIGAVYLDLITASPYLSNDVLALVAEQDAPFTQEMILNIMLANPHSSRSYWVQNNLDNRNSPLPTNYRDSINGLVEVYTHRDTLGAELSALSEEHDLILSELLYSYMTDSLFSIDSISPYLLHPTNPTYHYQLAELYFDNGNYEAYESVTDSIPLKFNLNESQENYHSAFTGLYSQLQSWHGDSVNLFEKDSSRLVWLLNYTNTHSVYPSRVHALLAANDTFIITPNVIIDFEEEEPMIPDFNTTIEQIIAENAKSDILLFPNPANTEISLKWKDGFKSSVVKIYDMNGRLVHQQNWNESQQLTVNVSGWPSGIYFINVNAGSSENINRKLIINR